MDSKGILQVTVQRATIDKSMDTFGKMDPYARFTMGQQVQRTQTKIGGDQTPEWNEVLEFTRQTQTEITIELLEEDSGSKDDEIGKRQFSICQAILRQNKINASADLIVEGNAVLTADPKKIKATIPLVNATMGQIKNKTQPVNDCGKEPMWEESFSMYSKGEKEILLELMNGDNPTKPEVIASGIIQFENMSDLQAPLTVKLLTKTNEAVGELYFLSEKISLFNSPKERFQEFSNVPEDQPKLNSLKSGADTVAPIAGFKLQSLLCQPAPFQTPEQLKKEKEEKERLQKEKAEKERLEKEKLEKQKLQKEKLDNAKLQTQSIADGPILYITPGTLDIIDISLNKYVQTATQVDFNLESPEFNKALGVLKEMLKPLPVITIAVDIGTFLSLYFQVKILPKLQVPADQLNYIIVTPTSNTPQEFHVACSSAYHLPIAGANTLNEKIHFVERSYWYAKGLTDNSEQIGQIIERSSSRNFHPDGENTKSDFFAYVDAIEKGLFSSRGFIIPIIRYESFEEKQVGGGIEKLQALQGKLKGGTPIKENNAIGNFDKNIPNRPKTQKQVIIIGPLAQALVDAVADQSSFEVIDFNALQTPLGPRKEVVFIIDACAATQKDLEQLDQIENSNKQARKMAILLLPDDEAKYATLPLVFSFVTDNMGLTTLVRSADQQENQPQLTQFLDSYLNVDNSWSEFSSHLVPSPRTQFNIPIYEDPKLNASLEEQNSIGSALIFNTKLNIPSTSIANDYQCGAVFQVFSDNKAKVGLVTHYKVISSILNAVTKDQQKFQTQMKGQVPDAELQDCYSNCADLKQEYKARVVVTNEKPEQKDNSITEQTASLSDGPILYTVPGSLDLVDISIKKFVKTPTKMDFNLESPEFQKDLDVLQEELKNYPIVTIATDVGTFLNLYFQVQVLPKLEVPAEKLNYLIITPTSTTPQENHIACSSVYHLPIAIATAKSEQIHFIERGYWYARGLTNFSEQLGQVIERSTFRNFHPDGDNTQADFFSYVESVEKGLYFSRGFIIPIIAYESFEEGQIGEGFERIKTLQGKLKGGTPIKENNALGVYDKVIPNRPKTQKQVILIGPLAKTLLDAVTDQSSFEVIEYSFLQAPLGPRKEVVFIIDALAATKQDFEPYEQIEDSNKQARKLAIILLPDDQAKHALLPLAFNFVTENMGLTTIIRSADQNDNQVQIAKFLESYLNVDNAWSEFISHLAPFPRTQFNIPIFQDPKLNARLDEQNSIGSAVTFNKKLDIPNMAISGAFKCGAVFKVYSNNKAQVAIVAHYKQIHSILTSVTANQQKFQTVMKGQALDEELQDCYRNCADLKQDYQFRLSQNNDDQLDEEQTANNQEQSKNRNNTKNSSNNQSGLTEREQLRRHQEELEKMKRNLPSISPNTKKNAYSDLPQFESSFTLQRSIPAISFSRAPRFGKHTEQRDIIGNDSMVNLPSIFQKPGQQGCGFGYGEKTPIPPWILKNSQENPGPGSYSSGESKYQSPSQQKGISFGMSRDNCKNMIFYEKKRDRNMSVGIGGEDLGNQTHNYHATSGRSFDKHMESQPYQSNPGALGNYTSGNAEIIQARHNVEGDQKKLNNYTSLPQTKFDPASVYRTNAANNYSSIQTNNAGNNRNYNYSNNVNNNNMSQLYSNNRNNNGESGARDQIYINNNNSFHVPARYQMINQNRNKTNVTTNVGQYQSMNY